MSVSISEYKTAQGTIGGGVSQGGGRAGGNVQISAPGDPAGLASPGDEWQQARRLPGLFCIPKDIFLQGQSLAGLAPSN